MGTIRQVGFIVVGLVILFLLPEEVFAQKSYRFFYGKVYDRVTRQPVNMVNFTVSPSKAGTVSDNRGEFSLYVDTIPSIMTVSHVGYQTKRIILDTATYKMTLYLDPVVRQLEEVVISAKPSETIFKDVHYAVLDYEIDSGYVFLLVYRYRFSKAELLCRTPGGDTVARSGLLNFTPRKVALDCIGYIHVLGDDSAYQVFRAGGDLKLIHPVTIRKYDEILGDCVASTTDLLYFKRTTDFGLGTEFYTINRKNKSRKFISQFRDEKMSKMLRRNPEDLWLLMNSSQPEQEGQSMSESIDDVKAANEANAQWTWVRRIQYPPIKSFLYRIGEFICVFNIPGHQMEFFDLDGNYSYKMQLKVDIKGEGRWTQEVIIDRFYLRVYTTFLKNGMVTLYEIDLNTGELTRKMSVVHPYPQKLRIFENYLYYLYDDPIQPDNKMLFRQKI
jgi:hypothetical protein